MLEAVTAYFPKPPLAFTAVSPQSRIVVEWSSGGCCHPGGTVQLTREKDDVWRRMELDRLDYLEHVGWWLTGRCGCALRCRAACRGEEEVKQLLSKLTQLQHRLSDHRLELELTITAFECLPPLQGCDTLVRVTIEHSPKLYTLEGVRELPCLKELNVSYTAIDSLVALTGHPSLETLNAEGCRNVSSLEGVGELPYLRILDVSYTNIDSLSPLAGHPSLEVLIAQGCLNLLSLEGVRELPLLNILNVSETSITSLTPLVGLPSLEALVAERCVNLSSLDGVRELLSLRILYVPYTTITSRDTLIGHPSLEEINTEGCRSLSLQEGVLSYLRVLNVSNSTNWTHNVSELLQRIMKGLRVVRNWF